MTCPAMMFLVLALLLGQADVSSIWGRGFPPCRTKKSW